ncbi:hypothetical protein LguiA_021533 [Lonicera macranthoides]
MRIYSLQIILVLCTINAQASAVVTAEASLAKPNCEDRCGNVSIPYPFGIGANCSATKSFTITCMTSFKVQNPFIDIGINLKVLEISLHRGTIRVENPVVTSNCNRSNEGLLLNLASTPFSFSDSSRFTAMGCNNLALLNDQETAIGGCMSFCNNTSVNDTSCYGINCCQTRIPPSLNFINVSLQIIDKKLRRLCSYAFMVDQEWFSELSNPFVVQSMKNVPVVLDWVKHGGPCESFEEKKNSCATSLCGRNARCLPSMGLCSCERGFSGNPYLLCQDCTLGDLHADIDECANPRNNPCGGMICVNTVGDYRCSCPPGFEFYPPNGCNKRVDTSKMGPALIAGTSISVAWLLLIVGTWWLYKIMKRRKKTKLKKKFFKRNGGLLLEQQLSSGEEGNVDKTKIFTSKELEKATDQYNQNRILGQGGQGTVYKGMLADGKIVAIKKSKIEDECQLEQFINEVAILSQINHRNVVKLHGCCLETEVPMLVYELIPNGTLFQYIHEENPEFPLSWDVLLRIATEAAGALTYLHSAASVPIYHRDIKSTNIILDEKFRAKVADFGTSRSLTIDQTHLTTKVLGTFGYLDPEYFQSSQFTEKSDVYSFGVVLVELLTGEKAVSSTREEGRSLALHFKSVIKENCLCDILDARVARGGAKEEIKRVANLAKRCLNSNGKKRPTMREVAMELEGIRNSNSAQVQEHHEAEVEDVIELQGPWDTWSTSIGYVASNNASASLDVQPLLYD